MKNRTWWKNQGYSFQKLQRLRPIDDDFMRCLLKDNVSLAQLMLRVLSGIKDLQIIELKTQADMKRLAGSRSICLDAYGTDSQGRKYDLEIQRSDSGADLHRARYHASVLDVENLNAGQDFTELPDTYIIFVTERDIFKSGKAVYSIRRMNRETGNFCNDGQYIIYVNGEYRGNDDIGRLMHDFFCTEPDDMYFEEMAEASAYYKKTETGVQTMCRILEEMCEEVAADVRKWVTEEVTAEVTAEVSVKTYIEACREFGIKEQKEIIERLLSKFDFLSEERAMEYVGCE